MVLQSIEEKSLYINIYSVQYNHHSTTEENTVCLETTSERHVIRKKKTEAASEKSIENEQNIIYVIYE